MFRFLPTRSPKFSFIWSLLRTKDQFVTRHNAVVLTDKENLLPFERFFCEDALNTKTSFEVRVGEERSDALRIVIRVVYFCY